MRIPRLTPGPSLLALAALAFVASCGDVPDADSPAEVTMTSQAASACNAFGLPDPGTCSTCNKDSAGTWRQICVTADCTLRDVACTPPVVSCGTCSYRFPLGFVQVCTRADDSTFTQSCQPAYKPRPPFQTPALP